MEDSKKKKKKNSNNNNRTGQSYAKKKPIFATDVTESERKEKQRKTALSVKATACELSRYLGKKAVKVCLRNM
jgi:hypothetical protein